MKADVLAILRKYKNDLANLKRVVAKLQTMAVSKKEIRIEAERLATVWVEDLRSPLEHKFSIPKTIIDEFSDQIKQLHILSRPNNQKSSYIRFLNALLKDFDNKFILGIQQILQASAETTELQKIIRQIVDADESEYLSEAIMCAESGFLKASVVMGWCAAIDKIQRKIQLMGFDKFNRASTQVKNQTSGKNKRWMKEFNVTSLSELQSIFDTDLIIVSEQLELLDSNQAQRLETCFQLRNHSAHPGNAPIEQPNLVSFFSDLNKIILSNTNFQ